MRGFETRLRRLEGSGVCPECAEARGALLRSIIASEPGTASRFCEGCGRDVRPTLADVDAILEHDRGEEVT